METSESSVEDIGTESKVNGDESNAEPVDANETVMDSNSQDANNEIIDNYQKVGIKRKADENIIEISQKIPKIDNSSLSDKSSKNGDDENGQEDSVNSDGIDLDSSSNSQTEEKDISKSESITYEKDEKPNDETLDTVNKTSVESVESRSEDAIRKSEDNITKNEVPNMIKSEDKLEESPKQKLQKSPQTPTEATRQSVRANRNSNPAAFLVKKPKLPTDMSNPAYKEPFKYGWRRELVYRANSESGPKRNGDIYYFTPDGKKVRSMREVLENLKNKELSTENFTFYKEPLGMNNPELEIIRVAKVKGVPTPTTGFTPSKKVLKVKEKQKVIEKPIITKSKTPKFGNALKVKFSGARLSQGKRSLSNSSKSEKKNKSAKTQLQMGTLPPGWQSPSKKNSEKLLNTSVPEKVSARSKRNSQRMSSSSTQSSTDRSEKTKVETLEKEQYMQNFLSHVSVGYSVLFQVFQYLKVQELLRASRVCRMWRDIASNSALWRIVRMKNSQVRDWEGLVTSLKRYGTVSLDLRKMLIPGNGDEMWTTFSNEIGNADSLRKIDLCKCPAIVVEQLANSNSNLEIINAVAIRCTTIDLSMYTKLQNLRELRLKSQTGINLKDDFSFLEHLKQLRHLSLLSFKDLGKKNIEKIANLIDLESLELGECDGLSENFGTDVLSKFENIEKLRLEKGPSGSSTYNILESISKLSKLQQIELVNFDVKPGFDEALALCTNIKRLLLIPTYITQSATTNNMVLNGIFQLSGSLTHFIWGVTLELLRVTELFIDQCDQTPKKKTPPKKDKKGSGDSIPILKPVPFMEDSKSSSDTIQDNTQVEILSLQALQKLLTNKLQDTKVKILKIPFHATWRQSITDVIQ